MSESKPLRVAIAGAGMISWHHLLAWKKLGERVRLVAVCDPEAARARKRADEFGIPHVLTGNVIVRRAMAQCPMATRWRGSARCCSGRPGPPV